MPVPEQTASLELRKLFSFH